MTTRKFVYAAAGAFILFVSACSRNNIKQDDSLKKYFDEHNAEGSFALLDNGRGSFLIYNLRRDTTRVLPGSTFNIVTSLIALQTGVLTTDSSIIRWDGVQRSDSNWNQDLSLAGAFKYSAEPHFRELARRIGRDTLQKWLDSLQYGNKNMGTTVDSFWLDNALLISPDEGLGLVKKLYFDQLPFRKGVQKTVRDLMRQEDNSNYIISYKTGYGYNPQKRAVGWALGWIEENRHPYFFVLNLETADTGADINSMSLAILKAILKQEGFFEGKM